MSVAVFVLLLLFVFVVLVTIAFVTREPTALKTACFAPPITLADLAAYDRVAPVLEWLRQQGGWFDLQQLRIEPYARGGLRVTAERNLNSIRSGGEAAVRVPESAMLSPLSSLLHADTKAKASACCRHNECDERDLAPSIAAVTMEILAGSHSHWSPYLDSLIGYGDSLEEAMPFVWKIAANEQESDFLLHIGADSIVTAMQERRLDIRDGARRCEIDEQFYKVGAALVSSRSFHLRQRFFDPNSSTNHYVYND